jgi:hypothetical protein
MACRSKGQSLTFAGMNAHHMNGIAKRKIRTLQELARTMLIHANNRWPQAITYNLWPYALRMANDVLNETPMMQDKEKWSPQQLFSNTMAQPNPKHWKPFGCPVYVLENSLQSGRGIFHKWKQRSRVGIYLGRSPQHSRSVTLVLDRATALVSPQFHITFGPSFHTCKQDALDSTWQLKAGFIAQRESTPPPKTTVPTPTTKKRTQFSLEPPNEAATSPQKNQRQKAPVDRTNNEINNALQHHDLAGPSNTEPNKSTVRNEDKGSLGPNT